MLLLLLYQLLATVASEATTPVTFIKPLEVCPDVGYFFEREVNNGVVPGPCYLCFCKGTDHAVCSLRPDERCDTHYYTNVKREVRQRRSSGIQRGVVKRNKNSPQSVECKSLKSSKSIGCPPDDWCKGCTVCDCNAKGHWDCHVMSFCPTLKPTRMPRKKSRALPKEPNYSRRNQKLPQSVKVTTSTVKAFPLRKNQKKSAIDTKDYKSEKKITKKSIAYIPIQPMITVETKKMFQKKTTKDSPVIIKKYISTNSPIKSPELLKYKNDTKKFAQMLYKQYKSRMNNSPNQMKKLSSKAMGDKLVNKSSLIKKNIKVTSLNARKPMNTKEHKDKSKVMNTKNKKNKNHDMIKNKKLNFNAKQYKGTNYDYSKRNKREVTFTPSDDILKKRNVEIIETDNTTIPVNETLEATEISFTSNDEMASNLNNYAYTVDDHATLSMNTNKSTSNNTDYATTEQSKFVATIDDMDLTTPSNFTVMERKKGIKNDDNTTKHNVTISDFETTTIANNTFNVLEATKVTPVDFHFMIDNKSTIINYQNTNETENMTMDTKKILHGQDIKKMFTGRKKFSLTKLVKTSSARSKKYHTKNNTLSDSKSTSIRINGTLNDIQTVLDKLLHGFIRNNTKEKLKKKSNTAVKYLKKLFSKLFSISSSNNHKTTDDKIAVMDSICENFGPCKISVKKLGILNYKVNQLISETHKALNSIRIIKGLLQLVEDRKEKNNENVTVKEPDFKMHVKKLNAILKDNYAPEDQLTQTQQTQIFYIKSNTEVFIKSIGKFANILNDIINIIKTENIKNKRTMHSFKIIKNNHPRLQDREVVGKIKNLLLRYNLLQNTFLRKMYEALTTLEVQNRAKTSNNKKNKKGNGKMYKMELDKYIDNINFNLKKLKDLAAKVGSKDRRKRETMGDDEAIEYLLTVMEYLLKRNNSLETPPDNDGIDLLIEAIKSAPDIKPIKKKVLQYVPVKNTGSIDSAESKEENFSNSKKFSKKPVSEVTKKAEKLEEESDDNDVVREDRRKTLDTYTKPVEITTKLDVVVADLSDLITEYPSKVYMATYDNYENTEKPFFETAASNVKTNGETEKAMKKEDAAKEDESDTVTLDEDNTKLIPKTSTDLFAESQTEPATISSTDKTRAEKGKMRFYSPSGSEYPIKSSKKPKTKFDLINEAYEEEMNERKTLTTRRPGPVRSKGETGNRDKKKLVSDVSSITKEVDDVKENKESEDIIYRKQMDLLNSLDYGTEKSMPEDSDSKDFSPLDRLNNDAFPSYFV